MNDLFIGIDPGINVVCVAAVQGDRIDCWAIRLKDYINSLPKEGGKKPNPKAWNKLEYMLSHLEDSCTYMNTDLAEEFGWCNRHLVVEAQYPARIGNPDHQTRNGWVASCMYLLTQCNSREIAEVGVWTKGEKKEDRHVRIEKIYNESKVTWHTKELPKGLIHNMYDAIGLAIWGMRDV